MSDDSCRVSSNTMYRFYYKDLVYKDLVESLECGYRVRQDTDDSLCAVFIGREADGTEDHLEPSRK